MNRAVRRRHTLVTALALLGSLSLTACTGGPVPKAEVGAAKVTDPASRADLKPFYGQRLVWTGCATDGYECARLTVPLDYTRPENGRTFVLPVARAAAKGPGKRIGSLVFNPGGPGAGGASSLEEGMDEAFGAAVRARFDIVGFDPRGVGGSIPALTCEPAEEETEEETEEEGAEESEEETDEGNENEEEASDSSAPLYPRTEADRRAAAEGARIAAEDCEKHSGPILRHVGTQDAARDLDILRAALGDRELTYLGWSYGTSLGTSYAEQFPRRVRAMVLDGAIDPSLDWKQRMISQSVGFRRSVDDYAEHCAEIAGDGCPGRNPEEIRALIERLYQRAEREPLPVAEDSTYAEYGGMDATAVLDAVSMAMYTPEDQWEELSEALREADQGDATKLAALGDEDAGPEGEAEDTEDTADAESTEDTDEDRVPADNSDAALTAINCLDIPHPRSIRPYWDALAPADKAAGVYGTAGVTAELTCRNWPSGELRPHRVAAEGVPPVLVVGTTGDPSTPYEESVSLAEQFPEGMLLTYEGLGHTAYGRGGACVTKKVDAYLVGLKRVTPGATC
ncbi:alpha/beta hydrolase [Streptomyces sp. NPDC059452]|uniref:alpha/beta hydrolase n=1 Tax=Streptomyces sp. NPDC059452 TaxID=3346835 RepID=UPI0036770167